LPLATKDVATDRFGSGTASFWDASKAPTTKKESAFEEKDVEKVLDPVTGSVLKLKKLVKVKFTAVDPNITETKRQASKSRWKVQFITMRIKMLIFFSAQLQAIF